MRVQLEKEAALESAVVELESTFLFKGGEAAIYALPGRDALVAKVYHKPIAERAAKLAAMIAAPPVDPMAAHGHASIAWPLDRLLAADDRRFVGFVMPRVHNARPIFEFYNPRARLKQCPLFHYGYLVRTARNLAAAVRALHDKGYVIGDVNESNLLVTNTALVTLVDTDSFQVPDNGGVHRCLVGKPEYTPPELQNSRFADFDRGPEHDAFALTVLIFQLLMQGMHPFNGMFIGQGDPAPLGKRIQAGHFPYARGRKVPYGPNPHAPPYAVLPPPVQELMFQCFEEGHARSAVRPSAARWQEVLKEAERLLTVCSVNRQHVYHKGFDGCPWCELSLRHGRDPFPSPEEAAARRADTQTATDAPEATPASSSGPGGPAPTPTSPTRATTSKATVKPRNRASSATMPKIPAIPTDPNIPIDVLPAAAPVGEPFAFVEVTLVEPDEYPEARRRRGGPPSPFVQFLLNPAFWLITPAVIGLLVLLLAIIHSKHVRDNAPPVTTVKEKPQKPTDDVVKDEPDKHGERKDKEKPEP
jgi:DNA-binding helix-hairpin-helix protein with protein kinase domain